jgi:peptide/nickel transport system substrate-binding protein
MLLGLLGALLAIVVVACGGGGETTTIAVKGDTVIQTVIVEVAVKGDTIVETVVVEKEVKGDVIVQTAVPVKGSPPSGQPVQQGTLRVSVPQVGSPVFLNEKAVFPTNTLQYYFGIQETLLTGDKNSCSVPQLATGWQLASDMSKVTFSIRPGVHFYTDDRDWGEMTAEDVVFSYNSSGADNPSSVHSAAGELNSIFEPWVLNPANSSKVDAPFKQFQGDYLTANTVSECNDSAAVVSKALFDELGPDETLITPHGTGPFIVTDWKANEKVTFRANNDYWKQAAFVANLELIESPEGAIRTAQLSTGEVDIAPVPISDVPSLESNGFVFDDGLRQFKGNFIYFSGNYYLDNIPENGDAVTRDSLMPDADHPWIGDPNDAARDESARKVRQALSMAIDRELINETILAGFGGPIYGGHGQVTIHQNHPEFNDRWVIPFDVDAAKALLAEAGYADGFSVPDYFCPVDIGTNGEVCQAVAGMWKDLLNIDVQLDTSAYTARRPTMVGRTINTIWQTTWGPNRLAYDGESGGTDGCCLFPQPTGGYNPGLEHQMYYDVFIDTGGSEKGSPENLAAREAYYDWAFEQRFSAGVVEVPTLIGINPDRVVSWTLQPFREINSFHTVILTQE